MSRGAFGQPVDNRFDPEGFQQLLPSIYLLDTDSKERILDWMRQNVTSRQATIQLLLTLAESAAVVMRRIAVLEFGDEERFAILELDDTVSRGQAMFGRIITATLNRDEDTQMALIRALLENAEATGEGDEVALVEVECIALLSYLLHELADRKPRDKGDTRG